MRTCNVWRNMFSRFRQSIGHHVMHSVNMLVGQSSNPLHYTTAMHVVCGHLLVVWVGPQVLIHFLHVLSNSVHLVC